MTLTSQKAYLALQKHYSETSSLHMRDLFKEDPERFNKFSLKLDDFVLDYSKNRITDETLPLLINLANECGLKDKINAMFSGKQINFTENRSVLHIALRNRSNTPIYVNNKDVMPEINRVLEKMHLFSDQVRNGSWKGATGKSITDIVNIGIGGSDLGPYMATEALKKYKTEKLIATTIDLIK